MRTGIKHATQKAVAAQFPELSPMSEQFPNVNKANMSTAKLWRESRLGGVEVLREFCPGQRFPSHSHEEYVITLMIAGAERFRHARQSFDVPAGNILLVNPGEVHSNDPIGEVGVSYMTLYPSIEMMQDIQSQTAVDLQQSLYLRSSVVNDDDLSGLMYRLHIAIESGASHLDVESRFYNFAQLLFTRHGGMAPPASQLSDNASMSLIHDFLSDHFKDAVTLTQLSQLTGLSIFHLLRTFRDQFGIPPHEFQTQTRIRHAKQLLRLGHRTAEVGFEVGFFDQSHFIRHFRRLVGVTPGQFAKSSNSVQYNGLLQSQ